MSRKSLAMALALCGCLSRQARVDELVQAHRLKDALSVWNERVAEAPIDAEALAGRVRVLVLLADEAAALGQAARAHEALGEALSQVIEADGWAEKAQVSSPALDQLRAELTADFVARFQRARDLNQFSDVHHEVQTLGSRLEQSKLELKTALRGLREATVARCIALRGAVATPHLARLVWRYCASLDVRVQPPGAAPECRASLEVELHLEPNDAEPDFSEAAISAFGQSPWADPRATGAVKARVAGFMPSTETEAPVTLVANWSTSEPYSTTESQTEYYTESYSTTESYTYSCPGSSGYSSTCTGSRSVTRTRPATRTVQKSVTRYRSVSHSFAYAAVQKTLTHKAEWQLAIALPATSTPLTFSWSDADQQRDVEHEVTNAVAGVEPHHAQLPTARQWHGRQAKVLLTKLAVALEGAWQATFCQESLELPEKAARCLAGHGESSASELTLSRYLGEPVEVVRAIARGSP